jgi:hypothetical protein
MSERELATSNKESAEAFCAECQHWVQPNAANTASMIGIVVTIHRCPGCQAVLQQPGRV